MASFAERLENRTLFAAIPSAVAAAYTTLIKDDSALKADSKKYTAALGKDVKLVVGDLKTFGHTGADAVASSRIAKDSATTISADTTVTMKFVTTANGIFHQFELADAAFTAKPNLVNGHKLVAADNARTALENAFQDSRFAAGIQKADDAAVDLGTTIGPVPATHATSQKLFNDVMAVNNDITNLNDIQGDAGDQVLADIPALTGA